MLEDRMRKVPLQSISEYVYNISECVYSIVCTVAKGPSVLVVFQNTCISDIDECVATLMQGVRVY